MHQLGNFRYNLVAIIVGIMMVLPVWVYSAGLVPCGGPEEPPCQTCHVVDLMGNIINWLIIILGFLAGLVIIYAGIRLVVSAGNTSAMEQAKKILTNMIIGYAIVLSAWLIIDYGIKMLVDQSEGKFGPWNVIECQEQPKIEENEIIPIDLPIPEWQVQPRPTASGANAQTFSGGDVRLNVAAIQNSGDARRMAEAAARQAGITDPRLVNTFVALVQQESSMCRNKVGPQTRYGRAYGCGQMLLSTAQGLDSSATADRLVNDDAYNLTLSAQYFRQRVDLYNGDRVKALAAYNGGTKANARSTVCPGQLSWQCERNTGYKETRNYVANITRMADGL